MSDHNDLIERLESMTWLMANKNIGTGAVEEAAAALRELVKERDAWQEEARRYAENAEYWRERYETEHQRANALSQLAVEGKE